MCHPDYYLDFEMKKFICRKCGWSGYEMTTIKTDEEDNELPEEEWVRGCPYCKTDKYITLEESTTPPYRGWSL